MLADSSRGLCFGETTVDAVRPRLLALLDAAPAARWVGLVEVLVLLAADGDRTPLALHGFAGADVPRDRARLDRVVAHLHEHYADQIRLATLAEIAAMSESQLQRFFKRGTRTTISEYLACLRIGHACAMLLEGSRPIAQISADAGYSQPSYFTRQFRAVKGMSPIEFRRRFGGAGGSPAELVASNVRRVRP